MLPVLAAAFLRPTPSGRARDLWLALLTLGLLAAAAPASAQVYRCEEGGRIVYADRPCPTNARETVVGPAGKAQPQNAPGRRPDGTGKDISERCAGGNADACRVLRIVQQFDAQRAALQQRCTDGDRYACDLVACAEKKDQPACGRAEGRPGGSDWNEIGRRVETRPGRNASGGAMAERVTIIDIACEAGGRAVVEVGSAGAVRVPGQTGRFDSVDMAARQLCSTPR